MRREVAMPEICAFRQQVSQPEKASPSGDASQAHISDLRRSWRASPANRQVNTAPISAMPTPGLTLFIPRSGRLICCRRARQACAARPPEGCKELSRASFRLRAGRGHARHGREMPAISSFDVAHDAATASPIL